MAATPESFLELLEKSKLLSAEKLATARGLAQEIESRDPRALAKTLVLKDLLTRWQAAKLLAGRSSFFVGKYKLIDQLGRGGMGGVFLVEHTMMNRTAALKVISRQLGKDPLALERFLTEARAIAALDHTNIAHAYDVDKEGERYYLVMEYIEGHDLQRMVEDEGPLDCEQAVDYMRQAAEGLAHAHGRNMIHCDIKPANLLVNRQGVVKILDMGMARLIGHGRNGSDSNERMQGTVDYMAPEQALDSPNLDHRVDIYSLGCTFYFLLTGKAPFPEGSIHERLLKHQTQEPRAIGELRPEVPNDLVEICRKMMAKEPADRYQTAEELRQVLGEWRPPPTQKLKRAVPLEATEAAVVEPEDAETPAERPRAKSATKAFRKSPLPLGKFKVPLDKLKVLLDKLKPLLADRRKAAIVGGIGLAVLVLLGVLVWAFTGKSRRADQAVAAQTEETAETDAKTAAKGTSDTVVADKKDKKEAEASAADKKSATDSAAKTAADKSASDKDAKSKEAPKPSDKSDGKATEKAADKSAAKPADKTADKPKTEAKPDKAAEKAKPAPAKPEPPAKPKEPPKPADPFASFPTAVDLPAEPGELGKINTPDTVAWDLNLEGGDKVLKGNRQFTKPEGKEEGGKPTWIVQLSAPGVGKDKEATLTDIAKFSRDGKSLRFEWAEGAPVALAGNLRLCTLKLRAGDAERSVALLKPHTVEAIPLNLDRATTANKVAIPWLPDPTKTRVQIVKVEGVKDCTISPQDPVPLGKKTTLQFMQKDARTKVEQVGLELTVLASTKSSNALSFSVQMPKGFSDLPRLLKSAAQDPNIQIEAKRKLEDLNRQLEKPETLKPNKKQELEVQAAFTGKQVFFLDLYALSKSAKIHFRVLADVGDQQVEVATSGATPDAKK